MPRKKGSRNIDWSIVGPECVRLNETYTIAAIARYYDIDKKGIFDYFKRINKQVKLHSVFYDVRM